MFGIRSKVFGLGDRGSVFLRCFFSFSVVICCMPLRLLFIVLMVRLTCTKHRCYITFSLFCMNFLVYSLHSSRMQEGFSVT